MEETPAGAVHDGMMKRKEDVFDALQLRDVAARPQDGDSPGRTLRYIGKLLVVLPSLLLSDPVFVFLRGLAGDKSHGDVVPEVDGGNVREVGVVGVVCCDTDAEHGLVADDVGQGREKGWAEGG